jgi:hypothetical protein
MSTSGLLYSLVWMSSEKIWGGGKEGRDEGGRGREGFVLM